MILNYYKYRNHYKNKDCCKNLKIYIIKHFPHGNIIVNKCNPKWRFIIIFYLCKEAIYSSLLLGSYFYIILSGIIFYIRIKSFSYLWRIWCIHSTCKLCFQIILYIILYFIIIKYIFKNLSMKHHRSSKLFACWHYIFIYSIIITCSWHTFIYCILVKYTHISANKVPTYRKQNW